MMIRDVSKSICLCFGQIVLGFVNIFGSVQLSIMCFFDCGCQEIVNLIDLILLGWVFVLDLVGGQNIKLYMVLGYEELVFLRGSLVNVIYFGDI